MIKFAMLIVIFASIPLTSSATKNEISVFKRPTCGCCTKWEDYLKKNGFKVKSETTSNMAAVKERLKVPRSKSSCHTGIIGKYFIEGHVPVNAITKLIKEKPEALGITVPDMPVGSPGMEMGSEKVPYDVLLVHKDGSTSVFLKN